ncbi:MAG: hypothetical protein AAF546_00980 [Verrucomicrobiota bacterium]
MHPLVLSEAKLLLSMLYGGGAFLSFVLLAYFSKLKFGIEAAGGFLGFYGIVFSGGSFASLGLYSRAPSWVIRDRDAEGYFSKKRFVLLSVSIATTLSLWVLFIDPKIFIAGKLPLFTLLVGILQVAILMLLCGISNGYKNFHLARINFVIAPNIAAILLFLLLDLHPMHSLIWGLTICNVLHVLLINFLTNWKTDVPKTKASRPVAAFSLKMILPVSILSVMPQIDIWILYNLLDGNDIFIYTFFVRFLMIPMFPIISFNNLMYSTLPQLAYINDFGSIERIFFGKYRRMRIVIVAASISLPLFAYLISSVIGVPFDWRSIGLIAALILGYGFISLYPPYEVLAYAFEEQSEVFLLSIGLLLLAATGIFLLAHTPWVWLGPIIPAACMFIMRYAYSRQYEAKKQKIDLQD